MRILLVDNHDSYTYNLFQLIAQVTGAEPDVLRNDDPAWDRLQLTSYDAAVISPGPGSPAVPRDVGHSPRVLAGGRLPVLGVCLGHQLIARHAGAAVRPAARPRHGQVSRIRHDGTGLFAGIAADFPAVRYHSLCVPEPLPARLRPLAWSEDGVLMALRHRSAPHWGVQFHPESVQTAAGGQLVANFVGLAASWPSRQLPARRIPATSGSKAGNPTPRTPTPRLAVRQAQPALHLIWHRLDRELCTQSVHDRLHAAQQHAYWLDSALVRPGQSRFSFLGAVEGPAAEVLSFRIGQPAVRVCGPDGDRSEPGTVFDALARRTGRAVLGGEQLPFSFTGGYVGVFGYELKALCDGAPAHPAATPDAVWLRADRFVAVDHEAHRTYLVAVAEPDTTEQAQTWLRRTACSLASSPGPGAWTEPTPAAEILAPEVLDRTPAQYLADILECQRLLRAGESYEICLTTTARFPAPDDLLDCYRRLRRLNPAPYGALLRAGELTVLSSSPECFLRVDADRWVTSRPIKGTAARHSDPQRDEAARLALAAGAKTRAENLMIVDLLRNDLGRVCEVGSVEVPQFAATESYPLLHQLVSTVRGRLRRELGALDAVRSCFPGGSMTGAPKQRTMEIIDRLEGRARGVYSGALGWLGFDGCAELSIVIRTAVQHRGELSIGAGGAIVLDSDPAAEYAEMLLKARSTARALPVAGPVPVAGR